MLSIVSYLLLQDRLEEARTMHALLLQKVEGTNGSLPQLQLDYLTAFLESYIPKDVAVSRPETIDFAKAHALARRYRDYPVLKWRGYFDEMTRFFEKFDGRSDALVTDQITIDEKLRDDQFNMRLARAQPSFDFEVKDGHVVISHVNVTSLDISYHIMNIETTFSTSPFLNNEKGMGNHAFIAPNHRETLVLPPPSPTEATLPVGDGGGDDDDDFAMVGVSASAARTTRVPLPPRFCNMNIMIEITSGGTSRSVTHYAHALVVQIAEAYGYLRVSHRAHGKPVPAAYVKVYARMADGGTRFWRDGYTALDGSFEYATLSEVSSDGEHVLKKVKRFAILVQGDTVGAVVKEAGPPKTVS